MASTFRPCAALLIAWSAWSVPAPAADLVVLGNGQRIVGTLATDDADPATVRINTGAGIIRLRREAVKKVELSLKTRMAQLKEDDLPGHVALARWCRAMGLNDEALVLLAKAVAIPGCDVETKGLHARLVDEVQGPEAALPLYLAYRAEGGADAVHLARLKQLHDIKVAYDAQKAAILGTPPTPEGTGGNASTAEAAPNATAPTVVSRGLDAGWDTESAQWSNGIVITPVTIPTQEGQRQFMKLDFSGGKEDKAAIKKGVRLGLSESPVLAFLVKNEGAQSVRVAVAVKTGDWVFHESLMSDPIAPGTEFKEMRIDLKAHTFKSKASGWANSGEIANLEDVKELQFLIYNARSSGSLTIGGVGFVKPQDL